MPVYGKIGVAVSGGMDSMALLHCLIEKGADIIVINIEHGIRGAQSKKDSDFVASFCLKKNIPFMPFAVNTIEESKKTKESIELCARRLRYEIFDKLLMQKTVDYIALAHHADDNAETILMRILRGTGIRGLKGIRDRQGFIHPLINCSRKQIEEYVKLNNIPYVNDATNFSDEYTRNFLRNKVFAAIKERFDNYAESFSRLSQNAFEADEFISMNVLPVHENQGEYYIELKDLQKAHGIVKKYTYLKVFENMGIYQDIELKHLDYINELITKENNSSINLPFGIMAIKEYDKLVFCRDEGPIEDICLPFDLTKTYVFCDSKYRFVKDDKVLKGISFDAEKIPKDAVLRNKRDGDIFKRYGGGTKKLNDYLTDIKMPYRHRRKLLVLASGDQVLMICGVEISDKIKIDEKTKEIYYINKETL